jgi:hypothetical protein
MVLAAAVARVLPHPPNFVPVTAMALFAGAYFGSKRFAFVLPLSAMFLGDVAVALLGINGPYSAIFYGKVQVCVYATFVAIVALGIGLQNHRRALPIAGATLASSLLFFLTTNFAVWWNSTDYAQTLSGLITCYAYGLPFFGWSMLGDLTYAAVFFGGFAWAEAKLPALREPQGVAA